MQDNSTITHYTLYAAEDALGSNRPAVGNADCLRVLSDRSMSLAQLHQHELAVISLDVESVEEAQVSTVRLCSQRDIDPYGILLFMHWFSRTKRIDRGTRSL